MLFYQKFVEMADEFLGMNVNPKEIFIDRDGSVYGDMKAAYAARKPIVDELLSNGYGQEYIEAIAKELTKSRVIYAEITVDKELLKKIQEQEINLDIIEKDFGIRLRFLYGLNRNGIEKLDIEDYLEIEKLFEEIPSFIGIDVMGAEDHGTELKKGKKFLSMMTKYAMENHDFLIRLHSGETTADISGILDALKIIEEESNKSNFPGYPKIRIGHAIHGCNEEAVELMKKMGVAVELNLVSNKRLGNIITEKDDDVKKTIELCQKNGIPIFLGTDGHGLYRTSTEEQRERAKNAGIDLISVMNEENEYIYPENLNEEFKKERFLKKLEPKAKAVLRGRFNEFNVNVINTQDAQGLKGKIPIVISGSSLKTRGNGQFEEYKELELTFQTLADVINSKKAYIVTGATNCGPERLMHTAVNRRNESKSESELRCVGVVPSYVGRTDDENARNDFQKIKNNTITDAIILNSYNGWNDFSKGLMKIAIGSYNTKEKGRKGCVIFVGGGEGVKTQIRLASRGGKENEVIPCFLYTGFENTASSEYIKSEGKSESVHEFSGVKDLIIKMHKLYGNNIFFYGFNIDELDNYIKSAKDKVNFSYQMIGETLLEEAAEISKEEYNSREQELEVVKMIIENGKANLLNIFKEKRRILNFMEVHIKHI